MVEVIGRFLDQVEPFRELSEQAREEIAGELSRVELAGGEILFREGDAGTFACLILEGRISIRRGGVHLLYRRAGEWVGEVALIDNSERPNTCVAEDPAVLLRMEADAFRERLVRHPEIARGMVRLLTTKLKTDMDLQQDRDTRLRTLMEASKLINSSLDTDDLIAAILSVAGKELNVDRGTVYFVDHNRRILWAKVASGIDASEIRLPIGQGLAGTVAETGETMILHDAYTDPRFDRTMDERTGYRTRSVLCVPIKNQSDRVVGVLQLLNKKSGRFDSQDLSFLQALSDHVAIAMENAMLHLSLVEKERMQKELQLAREIQRRLLPNPPDNIPGTSFRAFSMPCYEVGGDYYDFLRLPSGKLGIAIGDVSGKGVGAALIMSSLQAALRVAAPLESNLCSLIRHLNSLLFEMTSGRKYVTLFLAVYDPQTGSVQYVNAGHQPPILASVDVLDQLDATGPPIGLLAGMNWRENAVTVPDSSRLLLYTDGLTEAMNRQETEYGIPRLKEQMLIGADHDPDTLIRDLLNSISEFEEGTPATDDKTLVLLERS